MNPAMSEGIASAARPIGRGLDLNGYLSIWATDLRLRDLALVAVAAAAPVSIAAYLLWLVALDNPRHDLGFYLSVFAAATALAWALQPFVRNRVQRAVRLSKELFYAVGTYSWGGEHGRSYRDPSEGSWGSLLVRRDALDVRFAARYGLSLFALWPVTQPFVTPGEASRLATAGGRMRALAAVAASSALACGSVGVTAGLTVGRIDAWPTAFVIAGCLAVILGALARYQTALREVHQAKVALVLRHAPDILNEFGPPSNGALAHRDPLPELRVLTAEILRRGFIPVARGGPGTLPVGEVEREVRAAVRNSFDEMLSPRPPIDMQGALMATLETLGPDAAAIDLVVRLGRDAWVVAQDPEPGLARFRVTGGRRAPDVPVEIVVDAPGLTVEATRDELASLLPAEGGVKAWRVELTGVRQDPSELWVSLYSVGRFVQAVAVPTATAQSGQDEARG